MGMFLTSVIGAALAATAPPSLDDSQQQVKISYGDLDLSTLAGRRSLDRRIHAAAAKICGGDQYPERWMFQQINTCAGRIVSKNQAAVATRVELAKNRKSSILAATAIVGK